MACALVLLVSLLVLTSSVRPITSKNDVDHETTVCCPSVDQVSEKVSPKVARVSETLSDEGVSSSDSKMTSANKISHSNFASKVTKGNETNSETKAADRKEREFVVSADKQSRNASQNHERFGEILNPAGDNNIGSGKPDEDTTYYWKQLLSNVDLNSLFAQKAGIGVAKNSSDNTRYKRDLSTLKRILDGSETNDDTRTSKAEDDDTDETSQEYDGHHHEGTLDDEPGSDIDESNYEVPQMGESVSGDAYRRQDFSKRPKYYPDWGPKRTWRINMMRVWGKRDGRGQSGGRVKYWNK